MESSSARPLIISDFIKVEQSESEIEEPSQYQLFTSDGERRSGTPERYAFEEPEVILPKTASPGVGIFQSTISNTASTKAFCCMRCPLSFSFPTLLALKRHELEDHVTDKNASFLHLTQAAKTLKQTKLQPLFNCRYLGCTEKFSATSLRLAHENKVHTAPVTNTAEEPLKEHLKSAKLRKSGMTPKSTTGQTRSSQMSKVQLEMSASVKGFVKKSRCVAVKRSPRRTRNPALASDKVKVKPKATEKLKISNQELLLPNNATGIEESTDVVESISGPSPTRLRGRKRVSGSSDVEKPTKKKISGEPSINAEPKQKSTIRIKNRKNKTQHKIESALEGFKCETCDKTFTSENKLNQHVKKHHTPKPGKHACTGCELKFSSRSKRRQHEIDAHKLDVSKKSKNENYTCPICDKILKGKHNLNQHSLIHSGELPHECTQCFKKFRQSNDLIAHSRVHTNERPYLCKVCGQRFKTSSTYSHHAVTHSEEKRFKCTFCPKAFHRASDLRIHTLKHTGEKPFICESCGRSFAQSRSLKAHICPTDGNEAPLTCDSCGKGFDTKAKLQQHSLIHSEEKAFQCNLCEKSFVTKGRLVAHAKTHDPSFKPKTYKCEACDNNFGRLQYLVLHKCVPRPFKCPNCPKMFTTEESLAGHVRIHDPGNRHVCQVCQKEFSQSAELHSHSVTHLKDKIHSCTICEKGFASPLQLSRHHKIHESERVTCQICRKNFAHITSLTYHTLSCHTDEVTPKT